MERLLFLDGEDYTDDMPEIVRVAVRGVIFADGKLLLIEDNKSQPPTNEFAGMKAGLKARKSSRG